MAGQIVSRERIRAEFDRLKANAYEFSDPELCILVAANLGLPVEAVVEVLEHKEAA